MASSSARICLHHVGALDGGRVFPSVRQFEQDLVNVLYEANADSIAQIEERNRDLGSELHVLPYCLNDTPGMATFNINYDPRSSSLKEFNPEYGHYWFLDPPADHDYLMSEGFGAMEKRQLEMVTLDQVIDVGSVPAPDFLAVYGEGSEYEILQGAEQALQSNVLALGVKIAFHPVYKDEKLFGEITSFLSSHDFDFERFLHIQEWSPSRPPVGFRGFGTQLSGDALYLKRIDSIRGDRLDRYLQFRKLAFIAIAFGQFSYAWECLTRSAELDISPGTVQEMEQLSYYKFLGELQEQIKRTPLMFPPKFTSVFSFETSMARYLSTAEIEDAKDKEVGSNARALIRRVPFLLQVRRSIRNRVLSIKRRVDDLWKIFTFKKRSPVEALLDSYGLNPQARMLRDNRFRQSRFCEKP